MKRRSKRRLTVAAWTLAILLAFLGPIAYWIHSAGWTWWLSTFAFLPFLFLLLIRADRKGFDGEGDHFVGDGPWSPP